LISCLKLVFYKGFRDVIQQLEKEFKYNTISPHFLDKDKRQFSSQEANDNRECTKKRWVVEAVNGTLKKCFRVFDGRIENKSLLHTKTDIQIAGFTLI
jgi:hypothetical protein